MVTALDYDRLGTDLSGVTMVCEHSEQKATHSGASNLAVGYKAGPLTEYESISSNGWLYAGGDSAQSNTNLPTTYVGILERNTTWYAGMLNADKYEWQVRYSDGRRMTRGFGCALRTLRNSTQSYEIGGVILLVWDCCITKMLYRIISLTGGVTLVGCPSLPSA